MLARAGIIVALLAPSFAFAGATDVTLTTDTVLNMSGLVVNVSWSSATVESLTVNPTTFSFILQSGSTIQVTAPDHNMLSSDTAVDKTTDTCVSGASVMKYTGTAERTVTITPSASLCGGSSGSTSSGGGSASQTTTTTTTATTTAATPATPAVPATPDAGCAVGNLFSTTTGKSCAVSATDAGCAIGNRFSTTTGRACAAGATPAVPATPATPATGSSVSGAFTSNLTIGSRGDQVKALQVFLNTHGYVIASSGPGSVGNETTMFGSLTKAALAKYQKAKGIKPAVGYFGPLTRASVNAE